MPHRDRLQSERQTSPPPGTDLLYALDDADSPTQLTVYPADTDHVTTTWISAAITDAVDLWEAA